MAAKSKKLRPSSKNLQKIQSRLRVSREAAESILPILKNGGWDREEDCAKILEILSADNPDEWGY